MEFRTIVEMPEPGFRIEPHDEILFVGSCFADAIGRRFVDEMFPATVNPYGVMYNPASVLHTVERCDVAPRVAFFTLGTNHVYRLKETGEIVDNCQKRPQSLFREERLTVQECAECLQRAVDVLRERRADVQVVFTVSPIRYRKYGYHGSQLSKATLLLAIDQLMEAGGQGPSPYYFPAYELVLDELRDYRFYREDMLHPTDQAVEYIWQQLVGCCFSERARQWLDDWRPVRQALAHKPFQPDSEDYRDFMDKTMLKVAGLRKKYPGFTLPLQVETMKTL